MSMIFTGEDYLGYNILDGEEVLGKGAVLGIFIHFLTNKF